MDNNDVSPAPAGMIPSRRLRFRRILCEPRTRGDDPYICKGLCFGIT